MNLPQLEYLAAGAVRTLVEIAGYALLGQGLLAVIAGSRRDDNFVYRLFQVVTAPVLRVVRAVTPRIVRDGHVPFVAFFLLFWLWIALAVVKRYICLHNGMSC